MWVKCSILEALANMANPRCNCFYQLEGVLVGGIMVMVTGAKVFRHKKCAVHGTAKTA